MKTRNLSFPLAPVARENRQQLPDFVGTLAYGFLQKTLNSHCYFAENKPDQKAILNRAFQMFPGSSQDLLC